MAASPPDPRRLAWQVLLAVEDGAFADAALGGALSGLRLETRDRALATQLVYGTLAWQGLLDHILKSLGRPPAKLDAPIRVVLRLALFQLVKLDRVPPFAAVDTSVELSKTVKGGVASGMVNALLRRFLREGKPLALPPQADRAAHLALTTSHPQWLVEHWRRELGDESTEALLVADNTAAPTVLRVNTARTSRERLLVALVDAGLAARPTPFAAHGVILEQAAELTQLLPWRDGWFTVQGEASQLVAALLGARPGTRVLDVCAAPGGKALAVAEAVGVTGRVVALDRAGAGLRNLRREAGRLGFSLSPLQADATQLPLAPSQRFDAVLVDAPCTGLGTLRQHPEIRWRRTPRDVTELASLQRAILSSAAPFVRPGGGLVYATCTIVQAENDAVVDAFLAAHPDFAPEDAAPYLPSAAQTLVDARGALRTFPQRDGLDGFFAMRLKRLS
ncbi:MAG: 16S rRNA (cytosine(967)-C(5))-methyltransferase RsmB [bacterium]